MYGNNIKYAIYGIVKLDWKYHTHDYSLVVDSIPHLYQMMC